MTIHPDTRKFGCKFGVSVDVHVSAGIATMIRDRLEKTITKRMEDEGYRAIGAVRHYVEATEEGHILEYRAIQMGLPLGVTP
jgi:hypothetical protein